MNVRARLASRVSPRPGHPYRVLSIICLAQLIFAVDVTVVLVANVQVKRALGFNESGLTWIVTAYALSYGGLLLFCGRLSDRLGHRRCFLLGMAAFGVASGLAAASISPGELVAARALQGVAAAMVGPGALALLTAQFPEGEARTRALGYWAASGSAGGVVGYTLGGVLVGYLGWRWAFIVNLPIAAYGVTAGLRYLPVPHRTDRPQRLALDGAVTVTVGLGLLIYGVSSAPTVGWLSLRSELVLAGALVALGAFVAHECTASDPLIPTSLFARRESLATVSSGLLAATVGAAVFLGSLFLQQVTGWTPQHVGVATLPIPLGVAAGAFGGSRALRRQMVAPIVLILGGMVLMAAGLLWIGFRLGYHSYVPVLLPGWAALGLGLASSQIPLISTATSGVLAKDRGAIAGVYTMSQQVGTAIGLAVLTTIAVAHGAATAATSGRMHGLTYAMQCTAGLAGLTLVFTAAWMVLQPSGASRRRAAPLLEPAQAGVSALASTVDG